MNNITILKLIILVLFPCLFFAWRRRKYLLIRRQIPGPSGYPVIGIGLDFYPKEKVLETFKKWKDQYGSLYSGYIGSILFIVTSDPKIVEQILNSQKFRDKAINYNVITHLMTGENLFASKGEIWAKHRKLFNPVLHHNNILGFFPIFDKHSKKFVQSIRELNEPRKPKDIFFRIRNCALKISCETIFGVDKQYDHGVQHMKKFSQILTKRIFTPWLFNNFIFEFTKDWKECNNIIKYNYEIYSEIFDYQMTHWRYQKSEDLINIKKPRSKIIDYGVKLVKANLCSKHQFFLQGLTMIVAAFDTTANTVYYVLMCLAMYPEYQEKVYEEIFSIFPNKNFNVTFEELEKATYMDMVINETMRLIAPVPTIARSNTEEFNLNGLTIPKNTQIAIDIFNMHRDEEIWGPNSNIFYPDHFLKDNIKDIHRYAFVPFARGVRNCMGWRYGLFSVKILLIHILRSYKIQTETKFQDLVFLTNITIALKEYPLIEFEERAN